MLGWLKGDSRLAIVVVIVVIVVVVVVIFWTWDFFFRQFLISNILKDKNM